MARKQVLVQLDDDLVKDLDQIAGAKGVSRSALIRRATARLVEEIQWEEADRKAIESYTRFPEDPAENDALHRIALEAMADLPYEEG